MVTDRLDRLRIGRRIKSLRLAQELTVQGLAAEIGMSAGYISEVERGMSAVSIDKLSQIAGGLKIKLDTLLGDGPDEKLNQEIVQIPAALSEAADQLNLSHRATLTLLQGQRSLTARRSGNEPSEWDVEKWKSFYKKVKDYLPEC